LFLFNLFFVGRYTKQTTYIQNSLSKSAKLLNSVANALQLILKEKWEAQSLFSQVEIHQNTNNSSETHSIQILNKIINQLDYRLNLLVGVTLNGLLLWDLKILQNLNQWKHKEEKHVYHAIEMVGYFEAITSLAIWSYHHPHCNYPTFSEDEFKLIAKDIHHPLIPTENSIGNDFQIFPKKYISIITGSNMAGKSTFIRTIGINMVLAFAGTKPTAEHLECPIVNIVTYMRIKDALEENVSTFKAELNRIKLILDKINQGEKCFFLIDEMLRGTNSKDKLNGSIAITKKLLKQKAYTMIATHDIKLAELGETFPDEIKNYYFDIEYESDELVFDYKIKEGICNSFNASFLLKKIGIDT
jgi:DNA mismatch repair ATPase MutS